MPESKQPRKDSRSVLRKVFDSAEQAVATRAEPLTQSGRFASALGTYVSINRKVTGVLGKATGGVLHLVNIPTTRDVSKLHQHLSTVDSHLADLLREMDRNAGGDGTGSPAVREGAQPGDDEMTRQFGLRQDTEAEQPGTESRSGRKPAGRPSPAATKSQPGKRAD
jgi:hypothetical protein